MKPGMIILNSARGSLIDEDALVQSLRNKIVIGAWLGCLQSGTLRWYPENV